MNRNTETDTTRIVATGAAAGAVAVVAAGIGARAAERFTFVNHSFPGGVPTPGLNQALTGENA